MTIRLDPAVPIVWRSPHQVQLGVDDPVCTLESTVATERILAALVAGVPPGAIEVVAEHAGAAPALLDRVLSAVTPALLPETADGATNAPAASASPLVAVDDGGERSVGSVVRALLGALDIRTAPVRSPGTNGPQRVDAAVLAASFVIAPGRYGSWLAADVPHLPIVFGDRLVEVGPLIQPGDGPCLRCISLHRRDDDPAWPVIAVQLDGTRAATLTPVTTALAAAHACRMLDARLRRDDRSWATRSLLIDAASGAVSEREHRQHPQCGCRALPENVTVLSRRDVVRRAAPNSATTASWHG